MASKKTNPFLKSANQETEFTTEQLIELQRCSNDPVYFTNNYIKIQHPVKGAIPFKLYDYQENIMRVYQGEQYVVLMSARQTGKSETSAAYLLWYAIFQDNKTILIASNKNSNAMEMIVRIKFMYENLPHWLKPGVQDDAWSKHELGFDTGSRIISTATSESSGRGMALSLLYLDEFAFVKPNIQEEFWTSISPTLSTGGSCIISSTPNGDVNLFAQLWRGALVKANGFASIYVPWDAPPGRDDEFKQKQIAKLGLNKWLQEFECQFISSDSILIDSVVLNNITNQLLNISPLVAVRDVVFWENIVKGATYLVGIDPASGKGNDYNVMTIFKFPELIQVAEYRSNTMSPNDSYLMIKHIFKYFGQFDTSIYFSIENNGLGQALLALYMNDEKPPENAELISEEGKNKLGMTTTSRTKMGCCIQLKSMIESGKMSIRSKILLNELKSYVRFKSAYAAATGSTDDCISAVLIVIRLIEEMVTYDQDAFDKLYSHDYDEWAEGKSLNNNVITLEYEDEDDAMPMIF
jgi:hypothetical protein